MVKSEDIPAATQLFTPNWIVQYLVQNSVGRLWLMANPTSTLKGEWPYYIEPAEQTPEVNAQLDALIQTRMAEDGGNLNPESITVLDPACGSGHILVVAYDVLKAIYLERGYQARAIPRLILEKNLFGLDIDDRAAQLAGFALLMKARADDRRLLDDAPVLNVLSLQESKGLDLDELSTNLSPFGVQRGTLKALLDTFAHAKTFGSLIQIPEALDGKLVELGNGLRQALERGDLYAKAAAQDLMPLLGQAIVLAMQFDAVVANPPYMGGKGLMPKPEKFTEATFIQIAKAICLRMFIERGFDLMQADRVSIAWSRCKAGCSYHHYEELRNKYLHSSCITSLIHAGRGVFGSDFGSCFFTLQKGGEQNFIGIYRRLFEKQGSVSENRELERRFFEGNSWLASSSDLSAIPGVPIAYWACQQIRSVFRKAHLLGDGLPIKNGMTTGDNERFLRHWSEVCFNDISLNSSSTEEATASKRNGFHTARAENIKNGMAITI